MSNVDNNQSSLKIKVFVAINGIRDSIKFTLTFALIPLLCDVDADHVQSASECDRLDVMDH